LKENPVKKQTQLYKKKSLLAKETSEKRAARLELKSIGQQQRLEKQRHLKQERPG